jgi:hypothetical protein
MDDVDWIAGLKKTRKASPSQHAEVFAEKFSPHFQ